MIKLYLSDGTRSLVSIWMKQIRIGHSLDTQQLTAHSQTLRAPILKGSIKIFFFLADDHPPCLADWVLGFSNSTWKHDLDCSNHDASASRITIYP